MFSAPCFKLPMGPFASPPATPHAWHAERRPLYLAVTKDLTVDIRAGVGLNQQANDFLTGTGFAVPY